MELLGDGITPMHTTFETNKEKIRNAISDIAERATSFEEFQRLLKAEYTTNSISFTFPMNWSILPINAPSAF